jgi:hypothetical protein
MEVAEFFQRFVVGVEDELLALEILIAVIHSPYCVGRFK